MLAGCIKNLIHIKIYQNMRTKYRTEKGNENWPFVPFCSRATGAQRKAAEHRRANELYAVKYNKLYLCSKSKGQPMSKLVCYFEKFKGVQLYGMDIHIQRKTDNHSNKDIDLNSNR